jgi:hypothetical protein
MHSLKLTVMFGKNSDNKWRSLSSDDVEFFKSFPNVEILYVENLHAKYYANETTALLTSMNLYDFSQNNNVEAGVVMKTSRILGSENVDVDSWAFFDKLMQSAECVFCNEPRFRKSMFGVLQKYVGSYIVEDRTTRFFESRDTNFQRDKVEGNGYCIRTGAPIPFSVRKPFCTSAFESWSRLKDPDIPENYCHYSGEPSEGKTSFAKPVLLKNWGKAKQEYGL